MKKSLLVFFATMFLLTGCKNSDNSDSQGKDGEQGGQSSENELWCVNREIDSVPDREILVEGDKDCEHKIKTTYIQPATCTQNEIAKNICDKCGRTYLTYSLRFRHEYNDFNVCEFCGDKIEGISTGLVYEEVGLYDNKYLPSYRETLDYYTKFDSEHQVYDTTIGKYRNYCIVAGVGSCSDENLVIPSEHAGRKVIGIKDKAFYGNDRIKSVTITQNISYIGDQAFDYCVNLEKVSLPSNISRIGKYSFSHCLKLYNIYIPRNINLLDSTAFFGSGIEKNKDYYKDGIFSINGAIIDGSACNIKKLILDDHYCTVAEGAFCNGDNTLEELDVVDDDVFLNHKSFTTPSLKTVNITSVNDSFINKTIDRRPILRPFLGAKIQKASCTTELVYLLIEDILFQDGIKDLTILNYYYRGLKRVSFLPMTYLWGFPSLETLCLKGKLESEFNLMDNFSASFRTDLDDSDSYKFGRVDGTYIPKNFKTVLIDDISQFIVGKTDTDFKLKNLRVNKDSKIKTFFKQSMLGYSFNSRRHDSNGVENLYINKNCEYYVCDSYIYNKNYKKFIDNLIYEGTLEEYCQFSEKAGDITPLTFIANNILLNDQKIDFGSQETFVAKYYGVDNFEVIYGSLSNNTENLVKNLIIEEGFTRISLHDYNNLEAISFASSIKHIETISGSALKTVIMPDTITSIGSSCFSRNHSLETVVFSKGLTSLPYSTFQDCESLKSIYIPASIVNIAHGAFSIEKENFDIYFEAEGPLDSWEINLSSAKCNIHWGCSGIEGIN